MTEFLSRYGLCCHESWNEFFSRGAVQDAIEAFEQKYKDANVRDRFHPQHYLKIFEMLPLYNVKVVIVGQDPYPNPSEATGVAFSIPSNRPLTKSLRSIFSAAGISMDRTGDLTSWVKQGVLLINASLTIDRKLSSSRQSLSNNPHTIYWEKFSTELIRYITTTRWCMGCVICLWGAKARNLSKQVNRDNVFLLTHSHPASSQDFSKCDHFKVINQIVSPAINWDSMSRGVSCDDPRDDHDHGYTEYISDIDDDRN